MAVRFSVKRRMIKKLEAQKIIIIYGAGGVGRKVGAWIAKNGFSDFCYAVSDKNKNPEQIDGISVRQIDELVSVRKEAVVIVATLPALHPDIKRLLVKLGFKNEIYVNDAFLKAIGIIEVNGVYPEKRALYYEKLNYAAWKICNRFPCKDIIVFESKIDYTDNCRALSEYIEENMPCKYKIVWIVKEPEKQISNFKKGKIFIDRCRLSTAGIIKLNYYVSRAKFIFFTHPGWLRKWKPEQRVINLGHGNPFKKAESLPHVADCVLASGEDGIKYRKMEYKDDMRVEILGPPRNDWLFEKNTGVMKEYTDRKDYEKVIVCLPTYKQYETDTGMLKKIKYDSKELNEFCLNTIQDREELMEFNRFLNNRNVLFLCKAHYLQKSSKNRSLTNIKYINDDMLRRNGHDIYQLLADSDALITDFSSIYMDYLLLDRPVGFFCNSVSEYTRGFTVEQPEKYMPGMKIYNNTELENFVTAVAEGIDHYKERRKEARNLIFRYQDNQNCKRCAEYFGL